MNEFTMVRLQSAVYDLRQLLAGFRFTHTAGQGQDPKFGQHRELLLREHTRLWDNHRKMEHIGSDKVVTHEYENLRGRHVLSALTLTPP